MDKHKFNYWSIGKVCEKTGIKDLFFPMKIKRMK
jgi:hypothetical protein